jgi:hypothetical protein
MTLLESKEQAVIGTTTLLCELQLSDGTALRWANRHVQWNGHNYTARLIEDGAPSWRISGDLALENSGAIPLLLANADGAISELRKTGKLIGAAITMFAGVMEDGSVINAEAVFTGLVDNVLEAGSRQAKLLVQSRLNSIRASFPPMRIQKKCAWAFPANEEERQAALSSGEDGRYSPLFRCGYSAGMAGGFGNLNGSQPYTTCDYSRASCEERGMFDRDSSGQITRRFSGIQYLPPIIQVRGHGESSGRVSNLVSLDARYNDVIPAVYGMGWLQAPVVFARNDGNLTRMEVLLGLGEIEDAVKVVVNGYEIPRADDSRNMTGSGWYHLVSRGGRTGDFNLNFADSQGNPQGDPYGSLAYLSIVVPNQISTGKTTPKVEVLMKGIRLPVLDAEGHLLDTAWSANPAWIVCDILRRTGWKLTELDLASFIAAAAYCDEEIELTDASGSSRVGKRFEANLVLRRRYSVGELLKGLRIGSLLRVGLGRDGRVYVKPEATLAQQAPVKPAGSNAEETLLGGWPAYEFDDGTYGRFGILEKPNGEAEFSLLARPVQEGVNRVHAEIQDALHEFRQDSFSLADPEDIALRRQELQQALPALGIPHIPQAIRVGQTWLNKAIGGNVHIQFATNLRGIHLRPGDLISVTFTRHGFDRTLFRITEWSLSPSLDRILISAQIHQDHWYSDDPSVRYDRNRLYAWENRAPRGVVIQDASESLGLDENGNERALVKIEYLRPALPAPELDVPLVSFDYALSATGGNLAPGNYFYGFTATDGNGRESKLSTLIPVSIAGSGANHQVTLKGLSFPAGISGVNVYRGRSPYLLQRIFTNLPPAAQFTDDGAAEQGFIPPDANLLKVQAYYRRQWLANQQADAFSANTIGRAGLNLTPDEWTGKTIVIRDGTGKGQERWIRAHTDSVFTLDRNWDTLPDATSQFAIVDSEWTRAEASVGSEVTVSLPLFSTESFEINLRSVGSDGVEVAPAESPSLLWQIGVGSAGGGTDTGLPPEPSFGFRLLEGGTVAIGGFAFSNFANLSTAYAARLGIWFWDELNAPSPIRLASAITANADQLTLAGTVPLLEAGDRLQIGAEILEITEVLGNNTFTVLRGVHLSPAGAHAEDATAYVLERREEVLNLLPGQLTSTAAARFRYNARIPNVRIAAADMAIYNRFGAGPLRQECYTQLVDDGLRTLSGGHLALAVAGYLAIEASAPGKYVADRDLVVGDVYAVVVEPPVGAPVEIAVRVAGNEYCTLSIPSGSFTSAPVSRFNHAPIPTGSAITFDILSVPPASAGSPGKDLTVFLSV